MPSVTLYRLKGGHADLGAYVNTDVVGNPKRKETVEGVRVSLWRKRTTPTAPPPWSKVVRGAFPTERFDAPGPHDNALIVVGVRVDGRIAYWAMAFGAAGWRWLEASQIDRSAHLVAAFEVLRDPKTGIVSGLTRVVALDITRDAQRITRDVREEQILAAFEFDRDVQAFRGAKARANDPTLGRTLWAGDSIHLTSISDFTSAVDAIRVLEKAVRTGRARLTPVPGVNLVTDATLIKTLNDMVVDAIRTGKPEVALVLPDAELQRPLAIDGSGTMPGIESFGLEHLRSELSKAGALATLDVVALGELELVDPDEIAMDPLRVWPFVQAAFLHKKIYYLGEGDEWYAAPANWLAAVNARVDACATIDSFPEYGAKDEHAYNEGVLTKHLASAVSLDKKLVKAAGFGKSSLEILDVLALGTRGDGVPMLQFVASKRMKFSSSLSHLFAQVKTAADALQDPEVREAFLKVIQSTSPPADLLALCEELLGAGRLYDATRIEMVMAVIGPWTATPVSTAIPVLGRVGVQQTIARLVALGHSVAIARIRDVTTKAVTTKKATKTVKKSASSKASGTTTKVRKGS